MTSPAAPFRNIAGIATDYQLAPFVRLAEGFEEIRRRLESVFAPLTDNQIDWPSFKLNAAFDSEQSWSPRTAFGNLCPQTIEINLDHMNRQLASALDECDAREAPLRTERDQRATRDSCILIEHLGEAFVEGLKKSLNARA